jgi:hypothetical protein
LLKTLVAGVASKISDIKSALAAVYEKLGIAEGLPKMSPGLGGSPQRGSTVRGYRLDQGHPNREPGSPESGDHINVWDYSEGSRSSGRGLKDAVPIEPSAPVVEPTPVPVEPLPTPIEIPIDLPIFP